MSDQKNGTNVDAKVHEKDSEWKEQSLDDSAQKLQELINVLLGRGKDTSDLERAKLWLTIPSSDARNNTSVNRYRGEMRECIDSMVSLVDKSQDDGALERIYDFVHFNPRLGQLNDLLTIFQRLDSKFYALDVLLSWAKGFPKKWVHIDSSMKNDEMQMLAMTACYLEAKERQLEQDKNDSGSDANSNTDGGQWVKSLLKPIPDSEVERADAFVEEMKWK